MSPPPPDNGKTTDELIQRLGREIKEQPPARRRSAVSTQMPLHRAGKLLRRHRQPQVRSKVLKAKQRSTQKPGTTSIGTQTSKAGSEFKEQGENVGIRGRYVTTLDGKLVIPPPPPATGAEQSAEGETAFNPKTGDNFHLGPRQAKLDQFKDGRGCGDAADDMSRHQRAPVNLKTQSLSCADEQSIERCWAVSDPFHGHRRMVLAAVATMRRALMLIAMASPTACRRRVTARGAMAARDREATVHFSANSPSFQQS